MQQTMMELSKEMTKQGIMDEMVDDAMEMAFDNGDDLEEATQAEVDKVLSGLLGGQISQAPSVVTDTLPAGTTLPAHATADEEDEVENDTELEDMRARLEAIQQR